MTIFVLKNENFLPNFNSKSIEGWGPYFKFTAVFLSPKSKSLISNARKEVAYLTGVTNGHYSPLAIRDHS